MELVCAYEKCKRPILDRDVGRVVSVAPFDFETQQRVEVHYHQSCWALQRKLDARQARANAKGKK